MIKLTVSFLLLFSALYGADENLNAGSFIKEKKEIKELKKELNVFYIKKEEEYKKRKAELNVILSKIKKEKNEVQAIYDKNIEILSDIKGEVKSKTTKIYNSMKPKNAAEIFNKMIDDGNIQDVFDIILKLKEKNVTLLLKFLNVRHAATITQMLENYKVNNELKDKTNG